jgi:hypothetical protein
MASIDIRITCKKCNRLDKSGIIIATQENLIDEITKFTKEQTKNHTEHGLAGHLELKWGPR